MTGGLGSPALRYLQIADPPETWHSLGFTVRDAGIDLRGVRIELGAPGHGIVGWGLSGIDEVAAIDGLATGTAPADQPLPPGDHPNGAVEVDHVVIASPDFDRTAAALSEAGLELRRVHRVPGSRAMGFRRLGPAILELVESPDLDRSAPADFWGLVVVVEDLDALAGRLGAHLGPVHPAVQKGRRIASLGPSAGVSPAVAFMTPE